MTAIPTIPFVDLSVQHEPIATEIEQAIQRTIQRGDFILGQAVQDFETAFAQYCGGQFGVGVASGTDAIALGLTACGIGAGDEVILPVNTFIATLIGVIACGAKPIFVDCDPDTALMDLAAAARVITPQTKAIIPVHLYGQMVSPQALQDFAAAHNVIIFEDAAQAHGAVRDQKRAGSIGKAAAFSFYPSKNLGAFGDGGMVVTQDAEVAQKVRSLRNYGSPRKYHHTEPGANSRLDTLQAAILNVKLPHLDRWNEERNRAAQLYDALLAPLASGGIIPIQNQSGKGHVYHLYVVKISSDLSPLDRPEIQEKLSHFGIQTGIHYPIPCHLQAAYQNLGYASGDFPQAETLAQEILSLPLYPGMTNAQIHSVVDRLTTLLKTDALTIGSL